VTAEQQTAFTFRLERGQFHFWYADTEKEARLCLPFMISRTVLLAPCTFFGIPNQNSLENSFTS
jgi:hypothetical protein